MQVHRTGNGRRLAVRVLAWTLGAAIAQPAIAQWSRDEAAGGEGGAGEPEAVVQDTAFLAHILRRVAFGPSPDDWDMIRAVGPAAYVDAQLNPQTIQESPELEALLAQIPYPHYPSDRVALKDLVRNQLARAIYSRKQLQEQMVSFWEAHFNTDYNSVFRFLGGPATTRTTFIEWHENEMFREKALSTFEDLLVSSATSPAMLMFLDSPSNTKGHPNENYARELLELQTLGEGNVYTETDVEEVARCFSGWSVCNVERAERDNPYAFCNSTAQDKVWSFRFKKALHDEGPKTIFAGTPYELRIPPRSGEAGIQDGYDVLRHLANMPPTAEFVSSKLIAKFVREDVRQRLVDRCREKWLATGGDMREVLRTVFYSKAFCAPVLYWNKARTPLENLVATVRALEGRTTQVGYIDSLRFALDGTLNQPLFQWATPDGYPEDANSQIATGKYVGAIRFNKFVHDSYDAWITYDLPRLLLEHGIPLSNPTAIVNALAGMLYPDNFTDAERDLAVEFLTTDLDGNVVPLHPSREDYEERLLLLASYMTSVPQFFQQ